jgi:uracil phosphoribosyltransferase
VHVVSVIASRPGVDTVLEHLPAHTRLWVAAIDPTLNDHAYIVPGLGDAGDLAYGSKD